MPGVDDPALHIKPYKGPCAASASLITRCTCMFKSRSPPGNAHTFQMSEMSQSSCPSSLTSDAFVTSPENVLTRAVLLPPMAA